MCFPSEAQGLSNFVTTAQDTLFLIRAFEGPIKSSEEIKTIFFKTAIKKYLLSGI